MLLRDYYGKGILYTLSVPDSYPDLYQFPESVLTRLRAEFPVKNIYAEGGNEISLFIYDNNTFIPYAYVDEGAKSCMVKIHVNGKANALADPLNEKIRIEPLYSSKTETVFDLRLVPGHYKLWKIT